MACSDWNGNWYEALSNFAFRDAVLCPYQDTMGQAVFASMVVLGIINMPIYVRTQSAIIPIIITTAISGIVLVELAANAQTLVLVGLLMAIGLGPVLVLRRIQT